MKLCLNNIMMNYLLVKNLVFKKLNIDNHHIEIMINNHNNVFV